MNTAGKHKRIKAGVVQAAPVLFDLEASLTKVISWIEKGAREGCELLLFPESFIPAYPRGLSFDAKVGKRTAKSKDQWLDYWENSLEIPSPILKPVQEAIRQAGMHVALGVTEKEPIGGSLYCTLAYFNEKGEITGKHRKLKPTGLERYIWAEGSGDTLTTFNTYLGKTGGLICWENYMPLARMSMYQKGVEIYLAPTADARESWQSTMQHIAMEGRCFVLAANQFVKKTDYPDKYQQELTEEPEIMCPGGSVIYAPDGNLLAGPIWNREDLLTAELDFSVLVQSKLEFDVTGHYARPDVFKFHVPEQPDMI